MITLRKESEDPKDIRPWEYENCCFCRKRTPFWTTLSDRTPGQQVACCESCAKRAHTQDVPIKEDWCRRERIAVGD